MLTALPKTNSDSEKLRNNIKKLVQNILLPINEPEIKQEKVVKPIVPSLLTQTQKPTVSKIRAPK